MRTKTNVARKKYVHKLFKRAKGFVMGRGKMYRTVAETVERAEAYATRDRRRKKRTLRSLWITRISAAVAPFGLNYSRFMSGLKKAGVTLDRKVLADLAARDEVAFKALVDQAHQGLGFRSGNSDSTKIGYCNKNNQTCWGHRGVSGNDHNQFAYKVTCGLCGYTYGANGTDIHERKCPKCQGGNDSINY